MTRNARNTTRSTPPVAHFRSEEDQNAAYNDALNLFVMLDDCRALFAILGTDSRYDHAPDMKAARARFSAPHIESMLQELQRIANVYREEAHNGRVE